MPLIVVLALLLGWSVASAQTTMTITGAAPAAVNDAQIPHLNTLSTGLTPSRCVETDASGLLTVSAAACSAAVTFATIAGIATDAQIPHLNTLSTGLTASRCVQTDGSGLLSAAAAACGTAVAFTDLTGAATDAQIPNLNTLGTGLTASRCVQTDGTGLLSVAAGACGTASGFVDVSGTPVATQLGVWTDTDTLTGSPGFIYAEPLTLASSGWKFGSNGMSATFNNPTTGNDINARRAIDITLTTDGSNQNTNFSNNTLLNMIRSNTGPGQNNYDGTAKTTYFATAITAQDRAQGQHFVSNQTMYAWAMGDAFSADFTNYFWGGTNAAGDEGQGVLRLYVEQPGPTTKSTLNTIPTQTTCNTTTTQAITKNVTPQAVTVASTTGCNVNDRVVIDTGDMVGSKPRMEIVKITAVGGGTITAQFRESHISGVTVLPSVLLSLSSGSNLGAGRYLVNMTSAAYTTGTVASIAGTGFVGSGTTWTAGMVGGTALIPGCIALDSDDVSTDPFAGASGPLKGWFGIAAITDATHLNIAHFKEAAHPSAYKGNGVGTTATYSIRACARVLEVSNNSVFLEPNSFTWTAGDTVVLAHSVDLSFSGFIRMQAAIHSPNAEVTSFFSMANYGTAKFDTAIHVAGSGVDADYGTIVESSARTSGAALYVQGQSENGEGIFFQTFSGDNKKIRWSTSQSPAYIGGDYATGAMIVNLNSGAMFEVRDATTGYRDMKAAGFVSNGTTFAALGTPSNGKIIFCSDCTVASPCAGSGTGAFAKRLNSAWVCN